MYDIEGQTPYVLQHLLALRTAPPVPSCNDSTTSARATTRSKRSRGFLPVSGGTVVVYAGHAFTDQVAGFGGSAKRGIGRCVMAEQLKRLFEAGRTKVE